MVSYLPTLAVYISRWGGNDFAKPTETLGGCGNQGGLWACSFSLSVSPSFLFIFLGTISLTGETLCQETKIAHGLDDAVRGSGLPAYINATAV